MDTSARRRVSQSFLIGLVLALALLVSATDRADAMDEPDSHAEAWKTYKPIPLEVRDGRSTISVPCSRFLIVVSTLATETQSFPIRLTATGRDSRAIIDPPPAPEDFALRSRVDRESHKPPITSLLPPPGIPPARRNFWLMTRLGDFGNEANYQAVEGKLWQVGKRIQVYVDRDDWDVFDAQTASDIVRTFDERVFPETLNVFGSWRDVDGDGRFTVFVSRRLQHLEGQHVVDGFVRGSDFDLGAKPPFGNRTDMLSLNGNLAPGPYLRTVLAHEYAHALTYSHRSLDEHGKATGIEEEDWLDEAIAHLVEDLFDFSRENLDYRVSAFLSRPEHYPLVVKDARAGAWFRNPGQRGAGYLFLRWCADQSGPHFLAKLIKSRETGVANLEQASGRSFDDLFRRWSIALFLQGLDPAWNGSHGYRRFNPRTEFGSWSLAGPRFERVEIPTTNRHPIKTAWNQQASSHYYVVVHTMGTGSCQIEIESPKTAKIQVSLTPLPNNLPDLNASARWIKTEQGPALQAQLNQHSGPPARLLNWHWEPLEPNRQTSAISIGQGSRTTTTDLLKEPMVLKILASDAQGRRIAAWANMPSRKTYE